MEFDVIIPARYASTRLPGKPLLEVAGKPLIQWVYECAGMSTADRVLVATDDERIRKRVEDFGGQSYLTGVEHASGTDRIAELVGRLDIPDDRIIVNVQGDEPRIPPDLIEQVARLLADDTSAVAGTACHRIETPDEFHDPNVVKVVRDGLGRALYFSRAPVPWGRDADFNEVCALRHIGIYAFRAGFLGEYTSWPVTNLERTERLEQLRILEHGVSIRVCEAAELPGPGIDTPEDLEAFSNWVSKNG